MIKINNLLQLSLVWKIQLKATNNFLLQKKKKKEKDGDS